MDCRVAHINRRMPKMLLVVPNMASNIRASVLHLSRSASNTLNQHFSIPVRDYCVLSLLN